MSKNHNDKNIRPPSTLAFWLSLIICGLAWAAVLLWWFLAKPPFEITERVPGMDGEPTDTAAQSAQSSSTPIGAIFAAGDGIPPTSIIKGSWSRFKGDNFDNISKENIPLLDFSDGGPPQILWSADLGEGHAAPAVRNGRVYVLDYDEEEAADVLRCLSLDDGKEIWRRGYHVKVRRNHGMSRTIPAVTDSAVVTVGPMCHAMGVHAATGDLLWGIDLVRQYGAEVPLWYTGQCPLIDNDTVAVLAPSGGKALLVGIHVMTGEILWETPNKHGWKMSHSSVMPMTLNGRRIYLYCASGGFAGIAADGEERGSILFETTDFNQSVVAPSPVVMDNGRIFMTAGYGAGSAIFKVNNINTDNPIGIEDNLQKFSISMTNRHGVRDALASEQQTPLFYKGHLYAVLPKDAGTHRDQFVCVDANDVSTFKWTSGPDNLFGLGPFIIADGKFYILSDDGTLTAAAVSFTRFEKKGSVKISDGVDAWGPMALVSGRLLLRDSRRMFCVDLRR
jgi:outer membrane protein assembly factor BamB